MTPVATVALLSLLAGNPATQDTTPLAFHDFFAGARLAEIGALVERAGGRMRCQRAQADRRVQECRGTLSDSAFGGPLSLWASAVDSVAGVLTLSAPVDAARLQAWRRELEGRYGRVGAKAQGGQWMMQWVRRRRMLRLTWRVDGGRKIASVSLVDGPVLDAWGRSRDSAPRAPR